jgi:hypothetical protein
MVAKPPSDRMAIGSYDCDMHTIKGCVYPSYMHTYYPILPYYIPFRAMTNRDRPNMLVAGKTMAQSFLANSGNKSMPPYNSSLILHFLMVVPYVCVATRLHPVEWSSGTAAGVAAAFMVFIHLLLIVSGAVYLLTIEYAAMDDG